MPQGDKRVYIEAGRENMPVRAPGDFIFLKECAREIQVIIEGQPVTMRRGDKRVVARREPGRMAFEGFDVSNPHDTALAVTFVVGDGDYNSQIVTGELYVSEKVKTSTLNAISQPVEIKRDFKLINLIRGQVPAGDEQWSRETIDHNSYAVIYHEGLFWIPTPNAIRAYDNDGNLIIENELFDGSYNHEFIGGYYDPIQNVFLCTRRRVDDDENVYLDLCAQIPLTGGEVNYSPLSYGAIIDGEFAEPNMQRQYAEKLGAGFFFFKGREYAVYNLDVDPVVAAVNPYDIFDQITFPRPVIAEYGNMPMTDLVYLDLEAEQFWLANLQSGAPFVLVVDANTFARVSVHMLPSGIKGQIAKDPADTVTVGPKFNGSATEIVGIPTQNVQYIGAISCEIPGQPETARTVYVSNEFSIKARPGGVTLKGPIISLILKAMDYRRDLPDNYLDYVTRIQYDDGRYRIDKKSGTASFSYIGFQDVGELSLPSTVVLSILPEFISDAV